MNEKTTEVSVLDTVTQTVQKWPGCILHDYTCAVNAMAESATGKYITLQNHFIAYRNKLYKYIAIGNEVSQHVNWMNHNYNFIDIFANLIYVKI